MSLLFFASDYKIGLSSLLTQQALAMQKEKLFPLCLAGEEEQEPGLSQQMEDNHIDLIRLDGLDAHKHFKKLSDQIGIIISSNSIEHVHVQNNWQLVLVAFYKYKSIIPRKFKIIYTLHGFRHNNPVKSVIATFIIGFMLLLFANKVIVMSDYVKKRFFFLSYKIKKIYLGIDDSFFDKQQNDTYTTPLRLIFPAQFREGKNQMIIIHAIKSYIKQTGDKTIELYLPGSGPLLDEYKKEVVDNDLSRNVIFSGQCSKAQIRELYNFCNIGIISSNTETFGQSIVEPFVLGRLVLTRRVGVAIDIIQEGKNGYFFNDESDLCRLLVMLYENKEIIKTIGDQNFQERSIFCWEKIIKDYKRIIL